MAASVASPSRAPTPAGSVPMRHAPPSARNGPAGHHVDERRRSCSRPASRASGRRTRRRARRRRRRRPATPRRPTARVTTVARAARCWRSTNEPGQQRHRPHLGQGRRRQRDAARRRRLGSPAGARGPARRGRAPPTAGRCGPAPSRPTAAGAAGPATPIAARRPQPAARAAATTRSHASWVSTSSRPPVVAVAVALDRLEGEVAHRREGHRLVPVGPAVGSATSSRYWRWSPVVNDGCSQSVATMTRTPARRWTATSAPMAQRQRSIGVEPNGAVRLGRRRREAPRSSQSARLRCRRARGRPAAAPTRRPG